MLSRGVPAGPWLTEFTDLREILNKGHDEEGQAAKGHEMSLEALRQLTYEVHDRIMATGRTYPVPQLSARWVAGCVGPNLGHCLLGFWRACEAGLGLCWVGWCAFLRLLLLVSCWDASCGVVVCSISMH